MADQLLSSSNAELDQAGWARLGTMAQATQTALGEQISEEPDRSKTNGLAEFTLALWETLKRDWHRLFHPLEGLRERLAAAAQGSTAYREVNDVPTQAKVETPALSPLETTWTTVRDQLFEAAKNPQADPQQVATSIVETIPKEHHAAMAERLGWLAEMAQTTAKTLEQAEVKTPVKVETKAETKTETNKVPAKAKPQRQVPKQPVPDTPKVTRPVPVQSNTPKAKAR